MINLLEKPQKTMKYLKENPRGIWLYLLRLPLAKLLPDKMYLKIRFRSKLHKRLDFNNPKTFNEKIQWLKIYDRKPVYTTMVDKYEAKKYVADMIGQEHIVPTLGVWEKFSEIEFDKLPEQFVLKCTHDSGGLVICRDKEEFNVDKAKKKICKCLRQNYFWTGREWPYKNVKPRIIAEKYLCDGDRIVPEDYKVYCINEEPKYIVVFHGRFDASKRLSETVYDINWIPQNISLDNHFDISDIVEPRPEWLEEMLDLSRKLCKGISQLRVDFYVIEGRIYFGELTFHTASGMQPMIPESVDRELGDLLQLPNR